ncbi:MAG: hypothetical protein HRU19_01345 [Pseudobacteriovorax sp.]|nr:hypothetical protein [Pseudobacteriovorax sp.]
MINFSKDEILQIKKSREAQQRTIEQILGNSLSEIKARETINESRSVIEKINRTISR